MAGRPQTIHNNQSAINYVNKKGINELFEVGFSLSNKPKNFCFLLGHHHRSDGA
jgi:hypothetical protein